MAKKSPAAETAEVPSFLDTIIRQARSTAKVGCAYLPGIHAQQYWGIPIPHLAFQYLIGGLNVLPYSQSMELAGPPASLKSTLLMDMMTWAGDARSYAMYIDSENKTSPTLMSVVLGEYASNGQAAYYGGISSIEDWQSIATATIEQLKKVDPESRHGLLIGVDSLTAKMTETEQEKFESEGSAAPRGFPIGAQSITKFFKGFPAMVLRESGPCWPIFFIGVNHLKDKTDTQASVHYTPGGLGKDFQASIRLWSRMRERRELSSDYLEEILPTKFHGIKLARGGGASRGLKLQCQKSSLGEDRREIELDQYSAYVDNSPQQVVWFDWDGALTWLLMSFSKKPGFQNIALSESSRRFNLKIGDEKVCTNEHASIVGRQLQQNKAGMEEIRSLLRIQQCKVHAGKTLKEVFSGKNEPV